MKSSNPSKTQLRQAIMESAIDPRQPGLVQAILENNDPQYLIKRSIELLRQTLLSKSLDQNLPLSITLLGLARCLVNQKPIPAKMFEYQLIDLGTNSIVASVSMTVEKAKEQNKDFRSKNQKWKRVKV